MKAKENLDKKDDLYSYLNYINRDSWFLKGQLAFAFVLLVVLILYIIIAL